MYITVCLTLRKKPNINFIKGHLAERENICFVFVLFCFLPRQAETNLYFQLSGPNFGGGQKVKKTVLISALISFGGDTDLHRREQKWIKKTSQTKRGLFSPTLTCSAKMGLKCLKSQSVWSAIIPLSFYQHISAFVKKEVNLNKKFHVKVYKLVDYEI